MIPLRLAWAMTIHRAQGKALELAVVNLGKSEKCSGLALATLSRVRDIDHMLIASCPFDRLNSINNSVCLQKQIIELGRLKQMHLFSYLNTVFKQRQWTKIYRQVIIIFVEVVSKKSKPEYNTGSKSLLFGFVSK